jgi:hypothetical protein
MKQMTPKAGTNTYEAFRAANWTDEQLVAEGYLEPPKPDFSAERAVKQYPPKQLAVALQFASAGFRLFPERRHPKNPDKRIPGVENWNLEDGPSTTDVAQITRWCEDATVVSFGSPMCAWTGRAGLDLDEKNGKSGSAALAKTGITIPANAFRWSTLSGQGQHIIFQRPKDKPLLTFPTDQSVLGPGIDRRGDKHGYLTIWPINGMPTQGDTIHVAPDALLVPVTPEKPVGDPKPRLGMTLAEIEQALVAHGLGKFNDEGNWFKLCSAIKHETGGSDEGFALFDRLSQDPAARYYPDGGVTKDKYDARDCRDKWSSTDVDVSDATTMRRYLSAVPSISARFPMFDADSAGFGQGTFTLPPGASATPLTPITPPASAAPATWLPGDPTPWSGPPIPVVEKLHPVPKFDPDLLPPVLSAYVMDSARRMSVEPDYIAATVICMLGSIIGTRAVLNPKANDPWQIVPNLWGGIIGEPGRLKTPSIGEAMKLMDPLVAKAREDYAHVKSKRKINDMINTERRKELADAVKTAAVAKTPSEQMKMADAVQALEKFDYEVAQSGPALRKYIVNDITVEKLVMDLQENPVGMLSLQDELVGLLNGFEREGRQTDKATYLACWNGNQFASHDRLTRESTYVANACMSIFGGIQPDKLAGYLTSIIGSQDNDGFIQRFQVLVYPDPAPTAYVDERPDPKLLTAARHVFQTINDCAPVALGAALPQEGMKFPYFRFDPQAQALWVDWYLALKAKIAAEDRPILKEHFAKYDKLIGGLALIFHLVDLSQGAQRGPIPAVTAARAIRWTEYLEAHARRAYGLYFDGGEGAANALLKRIKDGTLKDGFTARDIARKHWSGLTGPKVADALEYLTDNNWIREKVIATGGKPKITYEINPEA